VAGIAARGPAGIRAHDSRIKRQGALDSALWRNGHDAAHGRCDQDEEGIVLVQRAHVGELRPVGEVPFPASADQAIGGGVAALGAGEGVLRRGRVAPHQSVA
jgi:hypothetical protein